MLQIIPSTNEHPNRMRGSLQSCSGDHQGCPNKDSVAATETISDVWSQGSACNITDTLYQRGRNQNKKKNTYSNQTVSLAWHSVTQAKFTLNESLRRSACVTYFPTSRVIKRLVPLSQRLQAIFPLSDDRSQMRQISLTHHTSCEQKGGIPQIHNTELFRK